MSTDKIDLYLRDTRGRIITHFLIDESDFRALHEMAEEQGRTFSELVNDIVGEALTAAIAQERASAGTD